MQNKRQKQILNEIEYRVHKGGEYDGAVCSLRTTNSATMQQNQRVIKQDDEEKRLHSRRYRISALGCSAGEMRQDTDSARKACVGTPRIDRLWHVE